MYARDPSGFTGIPKLPGYRKKRGLSSFIISNQVAVLYPGPDDGRKGCTLKLPKVQTRLGVGRIDPSFQLKEVHVVPENGIFTVYLVLQTDKGEAEKTTRPEHVPERVCAVDLGVNNLMAVSNNCGLPCILYRGGILKSVNHLYNRKVSAIMSEQTKGTDRKFQATEEYCRVTLRRNNQVSDFMHKTARHFIHWCVENRIDTIVAGVNRSWK